MNISLVPVGCIFSIWNEARKYLEPAVETSGGRWTMEHLCASLATGGTQLWVADDGSKIVGVLTTEVVQYPAKKALAMHFLGGENFDDWYPDMLNHITIYGQEFGCETIEGVARFGFWKWLQSDGFKKTSAFYEKTLAR